MVGRRRGWPLLVRPDLLVLHADRVLLAPDPGLHRRGLLRLLLPGLGLVTTHLDLDAAARARHAEELDALLPDAPLCSPAT